MAVTYTTKVGLTQAAKGDLKGTWISEWNDDNAKIEARLATVYAGNPNANVEGFFVGQKCWDSTNKTEYVCTTIGNPATAVWEVYPVVPEAIPTGGIILWSGTIAAIPSGWTLCDGTASTPDLRNVFVVGAQEDDTVAKTNLTGSLTQSGGSITSTSVAGGDHSHGGNTGSHSLSIAELPAHSHDAGTLLAGTNGAHTHDITIPSQNTSASTGSARVPQPGGAGEVYTSDSDGDHTHTITGSTANEGSGLSHAHSITTSGTHTHDVSILPPYYALAYIMKT